MAFSTKVWRGDVRATLIDDVSRDKRRCRGAKRQINLNILMAGQLRSVNAYPKFMQNVN